MVGWQWRVAELFLSSLPPASVSMASGSLVRSVEGDRMRENREGMEREGWGWYEG